MLISFIRFEKKNLFQFETSDEVADLLFFNKNIVLKIK